MKPYGLMYQYDLSKQINTSILSQVFMSTDRQTSHFLIFQGERKMEEGSQQKYFRDDRMDSSGLLVLYYRNN